MFGNVAGNILRRVLWGVTSIEVANKFGISIQNANQQLKELCGKGYLKRKDVGDSSGGSLFEYWSDLEV